MFSKIKKVLFNKHWYDIWFKNDDKDGWSKESTDIIDTAKKRGIRIGIVIAQGNRMIGVYCSEDELQKLIELLGESGYGYSKTNSIQANFYRRFSGRKIYKKLI